MRSSCAFARWNGTSKSRIVNMWVNQQAAFADDSKLHPGADLWASAETTLGQKRGDCEDYAIAKRALILALGMADSDMYLVIARDLVRRVDHAVLVVPSSSGYVVMDNGTDLLLAAERAADYRPIFNFAGDRAWIHGRGTDRRLAATGRSSSPGRVVEVIGD
ncbi:transglutaminase-like cysteine peptidase [Sphingomonas cavernae]|uniref:Transglutaminase n=1 Tax=Sphingomonas cavernae TaxID=2320861 RepID=A0A418WJN6_9SPHN|nr:transglutaminase-like cysteine peptidase [Sphingomonas cavernae]RJF90234.1 hypothetical protein D3876_08085 [Sphingomonas cavernae]